MQQSGDLGALGAGENIEGDMLSADTSGTSTDNNKLGAVALLFGFCSLY
jgi:hypothetical protein